MIAKYVIIPEDGDFFMRFQPTFKVVKQKAVCI